MPPTLPPTADEDGAPNPRFALGSILISLASGLMAIVHPAFGWGAAAGLLASLIYLLAPINEEGPKRTALIGASLSLLVLSVAGVHFTLNYAIPGILAGGRTAASKSAVSTLRTLYWAQEQLQRAALIDVDGDARGEFGFIAELSGLGPLRGGHPKPLQPIFANHIQQIGGGPHGGVAVIGPYCYSVFLPGVGGVAAEAPDGGPGVVAVDPDGAEVAWIAYAWPAQWGAGATTAFFINQREEILETAGDADGQRYSGFERAPSWDAASLGADLLAPLDVRMSGDGGEWRRWKNKQARQVPASE